MLKGQEAIVSMLRKRLPEPLTSIHNGMHNIVHIAFICTYIYYETFLRDRCKGQSLAGRKEHSVSEGLEDIVIVLFPR